MNMRVSRLSLTGFRGATKPLNIQLDPTKPVVVIFGENGTGKSTIVDAIDFVANGGLGSLAGRQSTPAKDYMPALGVAPATLAVELAIGDDAWKARLAGGKPSFPPSTKPRPVAHVLRRSQILDLLAAKPAERYQQLARFVAVPAIEAAEEALRTAVKDTKREFDDATSATEKAQRQAVDYWVAEGKPGAEALAWARELAAQDASALLKEANEVNGVLALLARASEELERVSVASNGLGESVKAVADAQDRLRAAESEATAAEALLMELLEKAEHYIVAHPSIASCPVCEKPIEPRTLLERLKRRREAGFAVDEARRAVEVARQHETGNRKAAEVAETGLRNAGTSLLAAARTSTLGPLTVLGVQWGSFQRLPETATPGNREAAAREAASLVGAIGAGAPPLRALSERLAKDAARLNAVKGFVRGVDEHTAAALESEQLLNGLNQALAIMESRRKAFVDGVLAQISARVCVLYDKIHPGEAIGDIRLATDPNPKKKASLNLSGRFNEVCDVPPEGYYSESHLDTLGISIFLALAERSCVADRPNLLILDDVLTSVDGSHLDRFVSLVHDEAERFSQTILTTHYRHWFETYRRGMGPVGHACLIELSQWSIEGGIRADRSTLPTEDLAAALTKAPLDRQGVASRAGVILETLLTHLSLCYKLRLPASKHRQFTLGELISAFGSQLKTSLESHQDGEPTAKLGPILEAIFALTPFRSWVGAHYNPLGDDVPNVQVAELGNQAVELVRALTCAECGEMAGKRAGSHWRCRCGKKRLAPLAVPGQDPPSEDIIP